MARTTRPTGIIAAVVVAGSLILGGCGAPSDTDEVDYVQASQEQSIYCVDENDDVLLGTDDDDYCEDDEIGSLGWFMIGYFAAGLGHGTHLDKSKSTARFHHADKSARTKYGLPATGTVALGKTFRPKAFATTNTAPRPTLNNNQPAPRTTTKKSKPTTKKK